MDAFIGYDLNIYLDYESFIIKGNIPFDDGYIDCLTIPFESIRIKRGVSFFFFCVKSERRDFIGDYVTPKE